MAIARGAGTEIIRSLQLEDVSDNGKELIWGAQQHIYTVLSIIIKCIAANSSASNGYVYMTTYDTNAGTTNQAIHMFQWPLVVGETFVWNDRFSFNGHEPVDFTGPVDSVAKQDAVADQGSSVAQKLIIYTTDASDALDVFCTFIDQNNA